MLRFLTAGESHGKILIGIIEGIPAGLKISEKLINYELKRRQLGFGRSERMRIENDKVEIVSGVYKEKSLGSPIGLIIKNKALKAWERITTPRPGHADLAGVIKYKYNDIRNVIERASARETAMRVAIGSITKQFLSVFNITVFSHTIEIGGIRKEFKGKYNKNLQRKLKKSSLRCFDKETENKMKERIIMASQKGDSVGGVFEIVALGVPVGLGSYVHFDKRLDYQLAGAIMSIPGVKGIEIGEGFKMAENFGSSVHDQIFYKKDTGFYRKTNNAGGIEGGISNGEPIVLKAIMKPIPTLKTPLQTVDIITKQKTLACVERADICAVPASGVIGEALVSFELVKSFLEKFGSDNIEDIKNNYKNYLKTSIN